MTLIQIQTNKKHQWENAWSYLTHWFKYVYGTPEKWAQHFPYSNCTIPISLFFKSSFDEGPIFTIFYWKAVQGLKHIYVVKYKVQKWLIALILYFQSLSWPKEAIKILFVYINHLIKAKSSLDFNMSIL